MAQHFLSLNPFLGGIVAGALHTLLGPDHLSSIITLSACQGIEAFWFGVRWAGGHLTGMATLGIVFTILQFRLDSTVLEMYEHGMDYLVGIMLIFFGGYFIFNAQQYFDSEWSLKPTTCACHSHLAGGYPSEHQPLIPSASSNGPVESSTGWSLKGLDVRKAGSALIGFVQGIACPGGLVGMAFLKQYTQLEIVFFFATFFATTMLAMGSAAMLYGVLTQRYVLSSTFALKVYYASCALSLVLGTLWIILTATGNLSIMMMHGHHHEHLVHGVGHESRGMPLHGIDGQLT